MERPKGATEKSQYGYFIQGGMLRSYCPILEKIPSRPSVRDKLAFCLAVARQNAAGMTSASYCKY